MSQVFISYRRADSASVTGRIYDRLISRFGRAVIFKDVDSIPAAADFRTFIEQLVPQCAVQLVVIGRNWTEAADASGRRLDNPDDLVRLEIEAALRHTVPVLPLLVEGAQMPLPNQLPPSLRPITVRNALPVRYDPDFDTDVRRVIAAVEAYLAEAARVAEERARAEEQARATARAAEERARRSAAARPAGVAASPAAVPAGGLPAGSAWQPICWLG